MTTAFIHRLRPASADDAESPARRLSFIEQLRQAAQQPPPPPPLDPLEPWRDKLRELRGVVGPDGVERITTASILEMLGVTKAERQTATRKIALALSSLGWRRAKVWRVRKGPGGRIRRGQARGYARASGDVCSSDDAPEEVGA